MSREIKFRAWHKHNKIMIYEGWSKTVTGYDSYYNKTEIFGFGNDVELMQYTGLNDKNGKEIYEGDIITCHTTGKYKWPHSGFVEYMPPSFSINIGKYDDEFQYTPMWANENFEIIGNIYENPELIKP